MFPVGGGFIEVGVRVEYSFGGGKVDIQQGCCCVGNCCDGESAHRGETGSEVVEAVGEVCAHLLTLSVPNGVRPRLTAKLRRSIWSRAESKSRQDQRTAPHCGHFPFHRFHDEVARHREALPRGCDPRRCRRSRAPRGDRVLRPGRPALRT